MENLKWFTKVARYEIFSCHQIKTPNDNFEPSLPGLERHPPSRISKFRLPLSHYMFPDGVSNEKTLRPHKYPEKQPTDEISRQTFNFINKTEWFSGLGPAFAQEDSTPGIKWRSLRIRPRPLPCPQRFVSSENSNMIITPMPEYVNHYFSLSIGQRKALCKTIDTDGSCRLFELGRAGVEAN